MKNKLKRVLMVLVISIISILAFSQAKTYAAELNLGIQVLRQQREEPESGAGKQWGYRFTATDNGGANADHRYVWKIVERQEPLNEAHFNYSKDIYCLRAGIGFDANGTSDLLKYETYNKSQIIMGGEESLTGRSLANFSNTYTAVNNQVIMDALHLTDENDLKAIKWILNNMYLRNSSDSEIMKTELLEKAITGNEDIAKGEIKKWITLDDIEIAQQIALWHFTNNSEEAYDFGDGVGNTFKSFYTGSEWTSDSVNNFDSLANEDLYPDGDGTLKPGVIREEGIKELYKYFIDQAVAHANDTQTVPDLKFATKNSELKTDGSNLLAGPFEYQDNNNSGRLSNYALVVTDESGNAITNYQLLQTNGTEYPAGTTAEDLLGKEFFIQVPGTTVKKVNVKITASYFNTTATMWTKDPDNNVQPVVIVEKKKVDVEDSTYVTLEEEFDLALRKFITTVNGTEVEPSRQPVVKSVDSKGNAVYEHPKDPVLVEHGDKVVYKIRVYNEGQRAGYVKEIKDYLPEGTQLIPTSDSTINQKYGWVEKETGVITTDYLSKEKDENNLIPAYDSSKSQEVDKGLSYKEVEVEVLVTAPNSYKNILKNTAEISSHTDQNGNTNVTDRDSVPDNKKEGEDDIDYEYLKLKEFDLALRKFIITVNGKAVSPSREPVVKTIDENGNAVYEHPKDPVLVTLNDKVVYTIRIFNEGQIDGYASEIYDLLPEGLEFISPEESEINKAYGWQVAEDGRKITTRYLEKGEDDSNLIKAYDGKVLSYKDVQVECKVVADVKTTDILINTAEIAENKDKNNEPVEDRDSVPNNGKEGEDDIDKEYLKVTYFDLALLKYVKNSIVIENGQETVTETGYDGTEVPKPIVKVELDRKKLENVEVKFTFTIKIINEGKIEGYATEISDYIPEGLEFIPEENPMWKEQDGKITTDALAKTLLQPGESATVDVVLRWIKDPNNMGLKTNVAEISDDYNEYDIPDIDSIPNNKKDGEDDIDYAHVMLAIKTGGGPVLYITLTASMLGLLTGGVFLIKKYVI